MRYRLWRGGKTIDLSREKKLGEGGEARVFCIAAMGMAAKIYHRPTQESLDKLMVMLADPPADPTAGQGHVSIAWPRDLLLDPNGSFRGYVMPLVEGMEPLVNFYVPKLRRQKRPLFDYHYLVTAALNVATAVRALHERNYVIGDVNESNILLADRALATVVDTDSFQVADAASGTIYRCTVGKPEFTPPELQAPGTNFARVDRRREHDCFGLAVMLFQLLMEGTHPFDGVYSLSGEPPEVDRRIAAGHFPHGNGGSGPNWPKPLAPPFGMLEPGLQRLFVQCFMEGHGRPSSRPDATVWRAALEKARPLLRTCPVNDRHRHWGHVKCPWCERALRLKMDPFPSVQAVKQGQHLLQRSVGAQTPARTPPPIPPRTAPARAPVAARPPAQPRPVVAPRAKPTTGRKGWAWAGVVAALVVLWIIIANIGPSRVTPPPAGSAAAPAKIEFLDSPAQGKSFHAVAGINMVWIAPGSFQMGDSTGKGSSDEKPVHEVRLSTGYWLGESDVTQAQWTAVMGNNPSHFKGDSLPVENVSWNDATAFCQKFTESERARGHLPAGMEYRLPTEAQWEYACRAGTSGDYAGDLDAMAWYDSNSGGRTHEVKTKRPNAWGLYDMHGNVWQWCSDWYGSYAAGSQIDPTGASTGAYRVRRGGSWNSAGTHCRSADRRWDSPGFRFDSLGFRLAAVPSSGSGATTGAAVAGQGPGVASARDERRMEAGSEIVDGARAGEERQLEIASGVSVTMCWVPAGSFTMGSPASEAGRSSDEGQTQVRLSRGFWLAKTECTQKTWSAVMGANPSHFKGEDLPVERVSWNDCQSFIGKLRQPGEGWRFDLPTEAQWEYACRAGTSGPYAGDLDAMAWYSSNSGGKTHPVGTKKGNAWRLMDMHGNVWEWCRDAYQGTLRGGADPEVKTGASRVYRGGSWDDAGTYCRSASRYWDTPVFRSVNLGFRLAAVPSSGSGATTGAAVVGQGPGVASARDERRMEAGSEIADGARAGEERQLEIASGVSVTMCWVPAGSFTMGSPASEAGRSSNEGQTQVRLSRGFWLAKTECAQKAWSGVMGANPSHFQGEDLPVEQISWNDCQTFIGKLRQPRGGWRFDLPTEAQWEYACRAGTTGAYAGDLDAMAWYASNSGSRTHPVGTKQANAWGLQDMHGNVWEWCRDAYAQNLPGGTDPEVKNGAYRVFRGGSWLHPGTRCRSANRIRYPPEFRSNSLGFRLAAVPSSGQ